MLFVDRFEHGLQPAYIQPLPVDVPAPPGLAHELGANGYACGDAGKGKYDGYDVQIRPYQHPWAEDLPMKISFGHIWDTHEGRCAREIESAVPTWQNELSEQYAGRKQDLRRLGQQEQPEDWCSDFQACRWHKSAEEVGIISEEGHVFTKMAGPRRSRITDRGAKMELASICMVFDSSLRRGGMHRYCYQIMDGELGAADGAGFVFDSKIRRNNIQRMRSVFLNQRGRICLRNGNQVTKLNAKLPPLDVGVCLTMLIDLNSLMARFNLTNVPGVGASGATVDVSLDGLFDMGNNEQLRTGFFCAVVTGSITIGIH